MNVYKDLTAIFKGKTVIVGVGNVLRGDDAFGPVFVKQLGNKPGVVCFDAGSAPENYTGRIKKEKPDTIIIADAVHLGRSPGDWDILRKDEIVRSGFTTHDLSPVMFIEYLEEETKADIYMLAVQPENVSFGAEMSINVRRTLDEIATFIITRNNSPL